MFRDVDKLRRILEININKPSVILPFLENLNSEILTSDDSHNNLLSRATAVCNEDYPFRYLTTDSINTSIENEYKTGVIIRKEKSLYDYIFKVYAEIKTDNIAYKNNENINEEIERILSVTDDSDKTLENFLESLGIDDLGSEFLSINDNLPGMVTTDRIFIYSALLNYSNSQIESTISYRDMLNNFLPNRENWDKIAELFRKFLENLVKGTINY